ncbi:hypothetical protein ABZV87_15425 [Streptomyces tendae]
MTLGELHDAARAALDPVHYDYVAGGAGEERALAANGRTCRAPGGRRRWWWRRPRSTGCCTRTGSGPWRGPPRPRAPSW